MKLVETKRILTSPLDPAECIEGRLICKFNALLSFYAPPLQSIDDRLISRRQPTL
jgi:hypothetical protein